MTQSSKKLTKAVLAGLATLTAGAALTACSSHNEQVVQCYGVDKNNPKHPLTMTRGQCAKLHGGRTVLARPEDIKHFKPTSYNDYVECYGVAEAGKNDCGTNDSACAGSEHKAKAPDAWIAFPRELCKRAGGRIVEPKPKKTWPMHNKAKSISTSSTAPSKAQTSK
jgi:uncharacterized membrane protein